VLFGQLFETEHALIVPVLVVAEVADGIIHKIDFLGQRVAPLLAFDLALYIFYGSHGGHDFYILRIDPFNIFDHHLVVRFVELKNRREIRKQWSHEIISFLDFSEALYQH
jgi:hypothetical protein